MVQKITLLLSQITEMRQYFMRKEKDMDMHALREFLI